MKRRQFLAAFGAAGMCPPGAGTPPASEGPQAEHIVPALLGWIEWLEDCLVAVVVRAEDQRRIIEELQATGGSSGVALELLGRLEGVRETLIVRLNQACEDLYAAQRKARRNRDIF